jgi:hypothetical protein
MAHFIGRSARKATSSLVVVGGVEKALPERQSVYAQEGVDLEQ